MSTQSTRTIRLDVLAGPPTDAVIVSSVKPHVIGRSQTADIKFMDQTISRRHAQIWLAADTWLISDLESRHGTSLNGIALTANLAAPLKEGDLIGLGPWVLVVRTGTRGATQNLLTTQDDMVGAGARVQRVPQSELSFRAQHRFDLLTESAATIGAAPDEAALADAVLTAISSGSGVNRLAFLRSLGGDDVELVGQRSQSNFGRGVADFSRSLLRAASQGDIVRLGGGGPSDFGQSIVQLGIHSAICAPIMLNGTAAAFVYLDARGSESAMASDAAAFCGAVAKIAGLALGNIRSREIADRQKELEHDLEAAREAQHRLLPPDRNTVGPASYAMKLIPGRHVAGDLFGAVPLPDGRAAIFLGDVSGKGVSAALLMATAKCHLDVGLMANGNIAEAVRLANHYVSRHCSDGRFITLWCGVFTKRPDGSTRLEFIDAGHGYWFVGDREGFRRPMFRGGVPVGVDPDMDYEAEEMILAPGSRLVVFSDGVVEQTSPEGSDFGVERAMQCLAMSTSTEADVEVLVRSVIEFAQPSLLTSGSSRPPTERGVRLADDVTVASIRV